MFRNFGRIFLEEALIRCFIKERILIKQERNCNNYTFQTLLISRNIKAGNIIWNMTRSHLEQTGSNLAGTGMKNIPASYKRKKFMKKFIIYKITFEWCWMSLSLGKKFEISTCEIAKTLSFQNLIRTKVFSISFSKDFG